MANNNYDMKRNNNQGLRARDIYLTTKSPLEVTSANRLTATSATINAADNFIMRGIDIPGDTQLLN